MELDIVIQGGHLVLPEGVVEGDLAISEGRIVALGRDLGPARKVLDGRGCAVLPGGIDPHTHIAYGHRPFSQNVASETVSMAVGGITSGFTFVGRKDPYAPLLAELIQEIESRSLLDLGIHPILGRPAQVDEIPKLQQEFGVSSFKFYPASQGAEIYPGVYGIEDGQLYRAFQLIRDLPLPATALVHAENWEIPLHLRERMIQEGRTDQAAYCQSRPAFCEEDGILRALHFARALRCRTYIVHVSTGAGARLIGQARAEGVPVIGETCPQYLSFDEQDRFEVIARVNPPLRNRQENQALWEALSKRQLSCMGSDHIPNRSRSMATDNVWTTGVGGYPGSGVILPVLMTDGFAQGNLTLGEVAELTSTNAARWFGLYPTKGALLPGSDADLVVYDLHRRVTYSPEVGHLSSDFTWFRGKEFRGWPKYVLRRGELVVAEGEPVAEPRGARYLRTPLGPAAG